MIKLKEAWGNPGFSFFIVVMKKHTSRIKSVEEIKKIIESAIENNSEIGVLEKDLFIIPVKYNSSLIKFSFIVSIVLSLLVNQQLNLITFLLFIVLFFLFCEVFSIIIKSYLVIDINNLTLFHKHKLFDIIPLGESYKIDLKSIHRILLESKCNYTRNNSYLLINDVTCYYFGEEKDNEGHFLIDIDDYSIEGQQLLIERYNVLAKCLSLKLILCEDIGFREFKEEKNKYGYFPCSKFDAFLVNINIYIILLFLLFLYCLYKFGNKN